MPNTVNIQSKLVNKADTGKPEQKECARHKGKYSHMLFLTFLSSLQLRGGVM